MSNINVNFIQLEQGIKNLIAQSQLPVTVVEAILKNITHEVTEQKQSYLIQLQQQLNQQEDDSQEEVE